MSDYLNSVTLAMADLELENLPILLTQALEAGEEASVLLQAMSAGMVSVGERFEAGEYFLADG